MFMLLQVLRAYFQAGNAAGYAGTMVWQLMGRTVENSLLNGGVTPDFKPERYTGRRDTTCWLRSLLARLMWDGAK